MKLEVRVYAGSTAEDALAADPDIGRRYDVRSPFWLDAESPDLARMVRLTRRTDGLTLTPELTFTEEEAHQAPLFQVQARKVLPTGEKDTALNVAHNDALAARGTDFGGVHLMERFVSSKGKVAPRGLVGAGEYGNEYVAGVESAAVLRGARVKGLELRPVVTSKRVERADALHLFTEVLAPPAVREEGVVIRPGDPPPVHLFGPLVYTPAAVARMPSDVVRTCEPFAEWQHPLWVVSARIVRLLTEAKVVGVRFTPVLVTGTPLHAEFVRRWRALAALVAANPRNRY